MLLQRRLISAASCRRLRPRGRRDAPLPHGVQRLLHRGRGLRGDGPARDHGLHRGVHLPLVLLQGNNLTNAEFIRYNGTPDNVVQRTKFGKTYQIGMNYKF